MKNYELTKDAENDLREVARYTLDRWGKSKLEEYRGGLNAKFTQIGNGKVMAHSFSGAYPALLVTKYQYHYIFYLTEAVKSPVIIGVIHERRDVVNRLAGRLS